MTITNHNKSTGTVRTGIIEGGMSNIGMNKMTPSEEDYLKVLLELSECDVSIHSKDIAYILGFSRASVSRMMDVLKDEGCIIKEKYGTSTLTESGRKAAVFIKKRHDLIKSFLIDVLGVEAAIADGDACRMEHVVSPETVEKLNQQLENLSETQAVQRISMVRNTSKGSA